MYVEYAGDTFFIRWCTLSYSNLSENFVPYICRRIDYALNIRGLSKKFVEFVNKNKTTILITFKFYIIIKIHSLRT